MAAPDQRASDAERDAVVDRLRAAAAQGRLDHDELEERVAAALGARTDVELDVLLGDLPGPRRSHDVTRLEMKRQMQAAITARVRRESGSRLERRQRRRETVLRRRTARFLWVNLLCVAIWGATGAAGFWPAWVLLGTGIVYGRYAIDYALGVDHGARERRHRRKHEPHRQR